MGIGEQDTTLVEFPTIHDLQWVASANAIVRPQLLDVIHTAVGIEQLIYLYAKVMGIAVCLSVYLYSLSQHSALILCVFVYLFVCLLALFVVTTFVHLWPLQVVGEGCSEQVQYQTISVLHLATQRSLLACVEFEQLGGVRLLQQVLRTPLAARGERIAEVCMNSSQLLPFCVTH